MIHGPAIGQAVALVFGLVGLAAMVYAAGFLFTSVRRRRTEKMDKFPRLGKY